MKRSTRLLGGLGALAVIGGVVGVLVAGTADRSGTVTGSITSASVDERLGSDSEPVVYMRDCRVSRSPVRCPASRISGMTVERGSSIFAGADLRSARLEGPFVGLDLRGADLRGAALTGGFRDVDLRDADLRGATFYGTDFVQVDLRGADLSGARLGGSVWTDVNAENAIFDGASLQPFGIIGPRGFQPPAVDPDRIEIVGTDGLRFRYGPLTWTRIALTGASLDGVEAFGLVIGCDVNVRPLICPFGDLRDVQFEEGDSLAGSDLRYANVSGMTVFDMDLSGVLLDGALVLDSSWTQVNARGLSAVEARFSGSRWQGVNLTDADLRRSQWADVDLSTEDARILYDASMSRSGTQGAALNRVDLSGADLDDARLTETRWQGVTGTGASFERAEMQRIQFDRSQVWAATLDEAILDGSVGSLDVSSASLFGTSLRETDLDVIACDAVLTESIWTGARSQVLTSGAHSGELSRSDAPPAQAWGDPGCPPR